MDMNDKKINNNKKDSITFDYHEISYIVSGLLLVAFFIFVSGYYWGKRVSEERLEYGTQINNNISENDKSLLDFYSNSTELNKESDEVLKEQIDELEDFKDLERFVKDHVKNKEEDDEIISNDLDNKSDRKVEYAAHLAGFGTKQAAQKALEKFNKHGYRVKISERISKSSDGSQRKWYQIVTEWNSSKKELDDLLVGLKRVGNLKDVSIVSRKN